MSYICPARQAFLHEKKKGEKKEVSSSFVVLGTDLSCVTITLAIKIVPWELVWR